MTYLKLVIRSLIHYRRTHLGVFLGTVVSTAILVGALVTGDSARGSLKRLVYDRLGKTEFALHTEERFFRTSLADELSTTLAVTAVPSILVHGIASNSEKDLQVNNVQVMGIDDRFWLLGQQTPVLGDIETNHAIVNQTLAARIGLEVGDHFLVRVPEVHQIPADAPLASDTLSTVALRVKVQAIATDSQLGRFSLRANQVSPSTVFVSLSQLGSRIGQPGYANTILVARNTEEKLSVDSIQEAVRGLWTLSDAGLEMRRLQDQDIIELRSKRVFIAPSVEEAAFQTSGQAQGVLTYFVNGIRRGIHETPYSFVSAPGQPLIPETMENDEIIITRWLADDLGAVTGDALTLSYYVPSAGSGNQLEERESTFRVRTVIPIPKGSAYRELMPPFPGLAGVENCRDWDPGVPIDLEKIRKKDQDYWDLYRGIPKAFITLEAAQRLWMNRFGRLTAVRYTNTPYSTAELEGRILAQLDPASLSLIFQPVLQQGLRAGYGAVDFGQLFVGLSMFILVAAILLTGLLYALNVAQRAEETGILMSLGFRSSTVRALLMIEGVLLALLGCAAGTAIGIIYNRAVLHGLNTMWQDAVGAARLSLFVTPQSLIKGYLSSILLVTLVVWAATGSLSRRPLEKVQALRLAPGPVQGHHAFTLSLMVTVACLIGVAIIFVVMMRGNIALNPGQLFAAGFLLLFGSISLVYAFMEKKRKRIPDQRMRVVRLAIQSFRQNRWRNLASAGMLACGIFVVIAVSSNRPVPLREAEGRASGTGGFALFAETTLPILHDLNTERGRKQYGLELDNPGSVSFIQLRLYEGDDASCLNLNRVENPRVLGVQPDLFADRNAFSFAKTVHDGDEENPWLLLTHRFDDDTVPAIADQTVITWGLKKSLGDSIDYTGENGEPVKLKLVAGLDNSIFQGNILIAEQMLLDHFPSVSGSRVLLIDSPPERSVEISDKLKRAFRNLGIVVTPTAEGLEVFNRVTNTYLSIFLLLGGLGLILGSFGLGIMVYRNILERRRELAIMRAVGYGKGLLHWIIFIEHVIILGIGVGAGSIAALVAVLPQLISPGPKPPLGLIAAILAALMLNGGFWIYISSILATRGSLISTLRDE